MDRQEPPMRARKRVPQHEQSAQPARTAFGRFCVRHRFRPFRVGLGFALIIIAVLVLAFGGFKVMVTMQTKTTKLSLQDVGFLETQAGFYTEVQSIKKAREEFGFTVPFTTSQYVFTYDGVITAGIDFSAIELRVDELKHEIHVTLPEAVVHTNEIDNDSFEVFEASKNIFTPLKIEDLNDAQIRIKENAEQDAINNGLLSRATENAKLLVRGFLSASYDMSVYTVIFD